MEKGIEEIKEKRMNREVAARLIELMSKARAHLTQDLGWSISTDSFEVGPLMDYPQLICIRDILIEETSKYNYGRPVIIPDHLMHKVTDLLLSSQYDRVSATVPGLDPFDGLKHAIRNTPSETSKDKKQDPTNPNHYTDNNIEPIHLMRSNFSKEEFEGFCKGNLLKYIMRYDKKNGSEDLNKAAVYLGWLTELVQKEEHDLAEARRLDGEDEL